MRKIVVFLLSLVFCGNIFGQDVEYRKPVILVNSFKNSSSINKSQAETFRNSWVASASRKVRIQVIDIVSESSLSEETKRRLREETLGDELARSGEMHQLGANYVLDGTVSDVVVTENKTKKKDGTFDYSYTAKLTYSLRLTSTADGTVAYSRSLITSSTKSTRNEAYSDVFSNGYVSCEFLNEIASLSGLVLDTDYTIKKDKLRTCYVNIGSVHGLAVGDYLTVTGGKFIAGKIRQEEIGTLEVIQVYDDVAECKVDTNPKELLIAMKEYLKMKTVDSEKAMQLTVVTQCGSSKETFLDKLLKNI